MFLVQLYLHLQGMNDYLFIFTSTKHRNIVIGHENRLWACSQLEGKDRKARTTRAASMHKGARGLIYSAEEGKRGFCMAFRTTSEVDPDSVERTIWPQEAWEFPFKICPLSSPEKIVNPDRAKRRWAILQRRMREQGHSRLPGLFLGIHSITAFSWVRMMRSEWEEILVELDANLELDSLQPEPSFPENDVYRDLL